ncbi:putative cell wall biogenesis protein Ecm15 [Diaporthe sp. PMI_573]|nr:putative cell wall biogenesis protein Ecm15 [Diaporthaceae sp. PMI_573]
MDYSLLSTPPACYADLCLVPIGTGKTSIAAEVVEVERFLKTCGLKYTMHSCGTTIEGSWDDVMGVIGKAHAVVHQLGLARIQSSIRVGTRTDKQETMEGKVEQVKNLASE